MSLLSIYDAVSYQLVQHTDDAQQITELLAQVGIRFRRWPLVEGLAADSSAEQILTAYAADIATLQREEGYVTADVVSLSATHPDKAAFRQKFLAEHTHSEDEVRFFVRGQGLFCLHLGDFVYQVLCCQQDLINVPAGTAHWFDMGCEPEFTAIRLFNNPAGWVAEYTGSDIANKLPLLA